MNSVRSIGNKLLYSSCKTI